MHSLSLCDEWQSSCQGLAGCRFQVVILQLLQGIAVEHAAVKTAGKAADLELPLLTWQNNAHVSRRGG